MHIGIPIALQFFVTNSNFLITNEQLVLLPLDISSPSLGRQKSEQFR